MAIQYYTSAGNGTDPTAGWTTGHATLAAALSAASSGDSVYIDMANIASGDSGVTTATTWTVSAGVTLHVGTQNGATDITTGYMGTTYWIGRSTAGANITLNTGKGCKIIGGLTLREHGGNSLVVNTTTGSGFLYADTLTLWHSSTTGGGTSRIGGQQNNQTQIETLNITYARTSSTISEFQVAGIVRIGVLTLTTGGATAPSGGWINDPNVSAAANLTVNGGDISALGSGATIIGDCGSSPLTCRLENTILPASFVGVTTQTGGLAGGELFLTDCYESTVGAVPFGYFNDSGQVIVDTGIFLTAGISSSSWKISTTSRCTAREPFWTPFIFEYQAAATVTPEFEVLREGNSSAYTDAEFWMESLTKQTSSSVETTFESTQGTGTNITTGVGTSSWTVSGSPGDSGDWSGILSQGSTVLAEDGFAKSRICAAVASSTIYVDPGPVG